MARCQLEVRWSSLRQLLFLLLLLPAAAAHSQALLAPGDIRMRSDLEFLADERVIELPLTTWPIPLDMLVDALNDLPDTPPSDPALAAALDRVQQLVHERRIERSLTANAALSDHPTRLRTFEDTPRTGSEAGIAAARVEEHWDGTLQVALAGAPQDGQELRFDGSFLQAVLGNWLLGAYAVDRWWGPGWDGSLVLSNAARPIPGLALSRRTAEKPTSWWLRPLGRWTATLFVGKLEGGRPDYSSPEFIGIRITAKPTSWFELAASRSVILCGSGSGCTLQTWLDKLDGQHVPTSSAANPSVQLAGFDARLSSPWRAVPLALYGQLMGRDEIGGFPDQYLGLFGAEGWLGLGNGAVLRAHLEWADTSCRFYQNPPLWNCGIATTNFFEGDRYRGFPIGDSLDQDAEVTSARADLVLADGQDWSIQGRAGALDRAPGGDFRDTLSPMREQIQELVVGWRKDLDGHEISLSVGELHTNQPTLGVSGNSLEAYINWTHRL
jgi:Capsule assembly protein Wzi